jgi:hypothetical protein
MRNQMKLFFLHDKKIHVAKAMLTFSHHLLLIIDYCSLLIIHYLAKKHFPDPVFLVWPYLQEAFLKHF